MAERVCIRAISGRHRPRLIHLFYSSRIAAYRGRRLGYLQQLHVFGEQQHQRHYAT